jgi:preprotein translocase SecE subunit
VPSARGERQDPRPLTDGGEHTRGAVAEPALDEVQGPASHVEDDDDVAAADRDGRAEPEAVDAGPRVESAARDERDETPGPMTHATPDVELAEAQLALGRPELSPDELAEEEEDDDFEFADGNGAAADFDAVDYGAAGARGGTPGGSAAAVVQRRPMPGNRIIHFLQGSWRELQRVQWPDRRQVMQATAVVIGFVIVAGLFLGVADFLSGKLVNYILK